MDKSEFHYKFSPEVNLHEAEATLELSLLATRGLHGDAPVRAGVSYTVAPMAGEIRVEGEKSLTDSLTRIYGTLLKHEFGAGSFVVREGAEVRVPAA